MTARHKEILSPDVPMGIEGTKSDNNNNLVNHIWINGYYVKWKILLHYNYNCFMAPGLCRGLPGSASTRTVKSGR